MIGSLKPVTAQEVLAVVDVERVINEIFQKGSLRLKQRTLADLWDRAYGRSSQNVQHSGGVLHAHVWRPLEKYGLTDEELAVMLKARMKLEAPVSNTPQNGPGFQVESSTAIEAVMVESEGCKRVESLP